MKYLNEIVCGNSIEILKEFSDESVDITITSPPYNVNLNYGKEYNDNISYDEYQQFSWDWLEAIYRITKETGRLYCVLDDRLIFRLKPLSEAIGWKYVQLLAWCKPNFAGRGRINGDWNFMNEYVLLLRKGKRNMMLTSDLTTTHSWFKETSPQTNFKKDYLQKGHPAQMPVSLVRKWVARTPGQVILDPFCGVGSVCMAAKELGRDYIGIDLSEKYCQLAEERIHSINTIPKEE